MYIMKCYCRSVTTVENAHVMLDSQELFVSGYIINTLGKKDRFNHALTSLILILAFWMLMATAA